MKLQINTTLRKISSLIQQYVTVEKAIFCLLEHQCVLLTESYDAIFILQFHHIFNSSSKTFREKFSLRSDV